MIDWQSEVESKLREENDSGSHTELDTGTFHPSALSRCKRQCCISKLGLDDHSLNTLWNFHIGNFHHGQMEEWFNDNEHLSFEQPLEWGFSGITITGHCDVLDSDTETIYDFKTRKSWDYFDGASESHKDQITVYMAMAGIPKARLVYIVKSASWDEDVDIIKEWPEKGYFEFDEDRWMKLLSKAFGIKGGLEHFKDEHSRLPETRDELPFDRCGCWLCDNEGDKE